MFVKHLGKRNVVSQLATIREEDFRNMQFRKNLVTNLRIIAVEREITRFDVSEMSLKKIPMSRNFRMNITKRTNLIDEKHLPQKTMRWKGSMIDLLLHRNIKDRLDFDDDQIINGLKVRHLEE